MLLYHTDFIHLRYVVFLCNRCVWYYTRWFAGKITAVVICCVIIFFCVICKQIIKNTVECILMLTGILYCEALILLLKSFISSLWNFITPLEFIRASIGQLLFSQILPAMANIAWTGHFMNFKWSGSNRVKSFCNIAKFQLHILCMENIKYTQIRDRVHTVSSTVIVCSPDDVPIV